MTSIERDQDQIVDQPAWDEEASPLELVEPIDGAELVDAAEEAEQADEAEDADPASTHALFDGDEGGLELDERRALVVLLKNRFITSESHPREWRTIVASQQVIRQRLNDLFLELVISPEREVAFKRPVAGSREVPTLLHDTIWQREETALLVYLRVRSRNEQARGEAHARVSHAELLDHLRDNRPDSATNQVGDERRGERAIAALKSAGLLVKTDEDDVFRISPAIEPMLPVTALKSLLTWLNVRIAGEPDEEAAPAEEELS